MGRCYYRIHAAGESPDTVDAMDEPQWGDWDPERILRRIER